MADKVTVRDLWNNFGYHQISGNAVSLDREIREPNVNRPGFELCGVFEDKATKRIVIIGEKESKYIETMSEEKQREAFEHLTDERIPMILVAHQMPCPKILLEIGQRKNFPIFTSDISTSTLIVEIVSYLEGFFAEIESIHGVLLQVYSRGVLLIGDSGVGKSEIALELIKKGHILVADDRVDVYRVHNHIRGEAPDILKNMLEIRGVGIIDVATMFGVASTTNKSQIDFVIYLKKWSEEEDFDRLGIDNQQEFSMFGISIPQITIPVREGRSIAVIIEAAVTNYILLKDKGVDSGRLFQQRVIELINSRKDIKR